MPFLSDTFTNTGGVDVTLASHAPEVGGTWVQHPSCPDNIVVDASDFLKGATGSVIAFFYNTAFPAGPDYEVTVGIDIQSAGAASYPGCAVRMDTTADTRYELYYDQTDLKLHLRKFVAGAMTPIDVSPSTHAISASELHTATLSISGSALTVTWDGAFDFSAVDGAIAAAGQAGVLQYSTGGQQVTSLDASDLGAAGLPFRSTMRVARL